MKAKYQEEKPWNDFECRCLHVRFLSRLQCHCYDKAAIIQDFITEYLEIQRKLPLVDWLYVVR